MNRGFGFYFGHALKSSARTVWHKGNMLKYWAWVIMELLAPFTVILGAMFALADIRQAKIAERENTVDVPQSFKVACRAQPLWTMLLAMVLEGLIFLAGLILIAVAGGVLGAIGYIICLFVGNAQINIIIAVFLAPCVIVTVAYFIIMPLLFAPTAYIIETNPDIGAADAISICFNTMKSRGKGTCFLNNFIPALVLGAILGLGASIVFALTLFIPDTRLAMALGLLVGIIFLVAFMLVGPMFALARKIAQKSLFEDIVLDPVNASKRTNGVNIRKCKGVKFDPAEYENELALLFDETYTDSVPVPETPSAKRKRELAERKAARAASANYTQPAYNAEPAQKSVNAASDKDEEDGELITVSDLIRDVETEAASPAEEPKAANEPAVEPVAAEEPAVEQPQETVQPETVQPAEEHVATNEPAEETKPVEEPVVEQPAETVQPAEEHVATNEPVAEPAVEQPAEKPVEPAKPTVKVTTKVAGKTTVKAKTAVKSSTTKTSATVKAKTNAKPAAKPDGEI